MRSSIAEKIFGLYQTILETEKKYHRSTGSVKLLAVSKGQPISSIQAAFQANQTSFAESYIQEATSKVKAFNSIYNPLEWHFIGSIQTNKIKKIAHYFNWVQSIDRLEVVQQLNQYRATISQSQPPLNVCIQINTEEELTKSGVKNLDSLLKLAEAIYQLPHLTLRGLMAIPKQHENFDNQRRTFHKIQLIFQEMQKRGFALDTLSMGMSGDFKAAIAEGSTMIRLGTAIFGLRDKNGYVTRP